MSVWQAVYIILCRLGRGSHVTVIIASMQHVQANSLVPQTSKVYSLHEINLYFYNHKYYDIV